MLTIKQVSEIREHLDKAQNPVFFFDNDADGLCSFILLWKFIQRGKGVAVKTFPDLHERYFHKLDELNSDYVFILDKPKVSSEFWKEIEKINIPVVWIDHHEIDRKDIPGFVNYFNPLFNKNKSSEPVTELCYQVTNRKEDIWLNVAGCVSDHFFPSHYLEFKKIYPELAVDSDDSFEIFYKSGIGRVARLLNFGLMDRVSNVVSMMKFLMKVKSPNEVLEDNTETRSMHHRFEEIQKKKNKFLDKAIAENVDKDFIYFEYSGDMSISSDLANELHFKFPRKFIFVVYITGVKGNISARGKGVRDLLVGVLDEFDGATGGGHEDAAGAQVRQEDLEKFKERILERVGG